MVTSQPLVFLRGLVQKYRHAFIVLLVGLGLMLLPSGKAENSPPEKTVIQTREVDLETRLGAILSRISGAGDVAVLLTVRTGSETLYQTDGTSDSDGTAERTDSTTVIVEDSSRRETGLVRRTDPPVYQGAVVVCQGADDPGVRLAIVEAVSCATGLGADRIKVVKMK